MSELALQLIAKEKKEKTGYLDLGKCDLRAENPRLEEVWEKLGELLHLEILILSNKWTEWEEEKKRWIQKRSKNKGETNYLEKIPYVIQELIQLKKLILSGDYSERRTGIKKLEHLHTLTALNQLDISYNQVAKIEGLEKLTALNQLDISYNQIAKIEGLEKLTALNQLDISYNQIAKIEGLEKLTALNQLDISYNQIAKIEGLEKLTALNQLDISYNQIAKIEGLEKLTALNQLDISYNQIAKIEGLEKLTALNQLDISYNQIAKIEGLEKIGTIERLDISNTQISDLTPIKHWIAAGIPVKRDYLEDGIYVQDCPLVTPPVETVQQGPEAVKRYFEEIERSGKTKINEAKLLLTGSGEVGKTSLRFRLNDKTRDLPKEEERTKQVDIETYTFDIKNSPKPFKAYVWDFGGQQIIHHFHRFFMNKSALYILMTETSRENDDFDYWLHTIQLYGKESPVLFVQNKRNGMPRSLDIKPYQAHFNIKDELFNVNLLDNEGLEELERAIQYHIQRLPLTKREIPNSWLRIREALEEIKSGAKRYFITYENFVEVCKEKGGIDSRIGIQDVGQFLHDLGVILWYHENPTLKQKIILERHWATEGIFKLFFDEEIKKTGHFNQAQAQAIWDPEEDYCHHCEDLIEMMKEFKICFSRKTQPDHYIIPALLSSTESSVEWPVENHLVLEYQYDTILPRGLVNYLSAEMYDYISNDAHVWSAGLWLYKEETYAKIKENRFRRKITIEIGGQHHQELIGAIKKEMDDIHRDYAGVEAELMIPCICDACIKLPPQERTQHRYSDVLKIFHFPNINQIMCLKGPAYIEVSDLLKNVLPASAYDKKTKESKIDPPVEKHAKKIFISYSHKDTSYCNELTNQLKGLLKKEKLEEVWYDHKITAGQKWEEEIEHNLRTSDIIILLISADFGASDYIQDIELPIVKERHDQGACQVIPILVRDNSFWFDSEWKEMQAIPIHPDEQKLKPIKQWEDQDTAWRIVIDSIKKLL